MHQRLFPTLSGKWGEIQIDAESHYTDKDLSQPHVFQEWIAQLMKERGIDYAYGGFLEDRAHIWRNLYHGRTGDTIHLGMDYTVPQGTPVALPFSGTIE